MAGSITFDSHSVPDDTEPVPILVTRYDKEAGDFMVLENVRCVQIQYREGPHPPTAQFEYVFQDDIPLPWPNQFEQVWPLSQRTGEHIVQNDDRLVVFGFTQSGARRVLFHGFAQVPQVDLDSSSQFVTFLATGVAIRLWDYPIQGSWWRDATVPNEPGEPGSGGPPPGNPVFTAMSPHFNPVVRGIARPNCTPDGHDCTVENSQTGFVANFPVFLDWRLDRAPDPDPRSFWTLGKMVRYLSALYNDESEVMNLDLDRADSELQAYEPKNGMILNPKDTSTFTRRDLIVRDYNAHGQKFPEVLDQHLGYAGFSMFFSCEIGPLGNEPVDSIKIFRKDAADTRKPKSLLLPKANDQKLALDGSANVSEMRVARDQIAVANSFAVETALLRHEISVILMPDYVPNSADVAVASGSTENNVFLGSNLHGANAETRAKYRRYVFDEAGDGHWDGAMYVTGAESIGDLESVLNHDPLVLLGVEKNPRQDQVFFVNRLRPPLQTLISTDESGRPRKATLEYSTTYTPGAGGRPVLWDGSAGNPWEPISGGWELLKDRIGVQITVDNLEAWTVGENTQLHGVSAQADPSTSNPRFYLKLTCVIEGDQDLGVVIGKRVASPTKFTVRHQADARDHFRGDVIDSSSRFASGGRKVVRNDYRTAIAHAVQLRAAHEFPPVAGSVSIPYLTNSYEIGDKIDKIDGRDVSFQTNASKEGGEAPVYPTVIAKTWKFGQKNQATILQLSDRREEPTKTRLA